jgi:hypothetical protein
MRATVRSPTMLLSLPQAPRAHTIVNDGYHTESHQTPATVHVQHIATTGLMFFDNQQMAAFKRALQITQSQNGGRVDKRATTCGKTYYRTEYDGRAYIIASCQSTIWRSVQRTLDSFRTRALPCTCILLIQPPLERFKHLAYRVKNNPRVWRDIYTADGLRMHLGIEPSNNNHAIEKCLTDTLALSMANDNRASGTVSPYHAYRNVSLVGWQPALHASPDIPMMSADGNFDGTQDAINASLRDNERMLTADTVSENPLDQAAAAAAGDAQMEDSQAPMPHFCSICMEKPVEIFNVRCQHACLCQTCSGFAGTQFHSCPICREPIRDADLVRIFFA